MMTNEELVLKDIKKYSQRAVVVFMSFILIEFLLFLFIKEEIFFGFKNNIKTFILGSIESFINLFFLGIAFFAITIKKSSKLMAILPIFGFLLMLVSCFWLSQNFKEAILGFAFGISLPIFLLGFTFYN